MLNFLNEVKLSLPYCQHRSWQHPRRQGRILGGRKASSFCVVRNTAQLTNNNSQIVDNALGSLFNLIFGGLRDLNHFVFTIPVPAEAKSATALNTNPKSIRLSECQIVAHFKSLQLPSACEVNNVLRPADIHQKYK